MLPEQALLIGVLCRGYVGQLKTLISVSEQRFRSKYLGCHFWSLENIGYLSSILLRRKPGTNTEGGVHYCGQNRSLNFSDRCTFNLKTRSADCLSLP